MTNQTTLSGLDGANFPVAFRGDRNDDGSVALRASLEVGGVAAGPAAPVPVSMPPMASVFSAALEAGHVLKAGPGTLYALQVNSQASGFVMLFDAVSVPADGAVVPRKVWPLSAALGQMIDKVFSPPLAMQTGIVVVFSSTGPFVKTGAAVAQFSAEVL